MRYAVGILVALAGLALPASTVADWPTFRHDRGRTGFTDEPWVGGAAKPVWVHRAPERPQPAWPGPARWDSYANVRGLGAMRNYDPCFHPVVGHGRLYFGSSADDSVHCLDAQTGEPRWTVTTDGPVRIAPMYSAGRVYFGSDDGSAYCVSAEDGGLIWRTAAVDDAPEILHNGRFVSLAPCRTGVLVEGDMAYYGVGLLPWGDSRLMAVDARTGRGDVPGSFVEQQSGLTMEGPLLATATHLVAPAGRVAPYLFDRRTGDYIGPVEGSGGSAVVLTADGRLFCGPGNKTGWVSETELVTQKQVATHQGAVATAITPTRRVMVSKILLSADDVASGERLWEVPCPQHYEVIIAGDTVLTGGDATVAAYALADGRLLWESPVEGRAFGLAFTAGHLFVSTDEGVIHCLRPSQPIPGDQGAAGANGVTPHESLTPRPASKGSPPTFSDTAADQPRTVARDEDRRGLAGHWRVHREMAALARRRGQSRSDQRLSDLTGRRHALVEGPVRIREVGGVEALELDGETNRIEITRQAGLSALPRDRLTVESWVRIDEADSIGGVVGCLQDSQETDRGWLLGCHHSRFAFAFAATGGDPQLTRLTGVTEIRPGHWYHVAATYDGTTAILYVNGRPEGQSTAQSGAIEYPSDGVFDMGAYHHGDTTHPLFGMLHEVRLYERVVPEAELVRRYEEQRASFRVPIDAETGPVLRFMTPRSARVRWSTERPVPTRLVLHDGTQQETFVSNTAATEHEVLLEDLPVDRLMHYTIATGPTAENASTREYELDTHFNFTMDDVDITRAPWPAEAADEPVARAAEGLLEATGADQGLCLIVGSGDGRLAWEIIRRSRLRIVGVDTDAAKVAAAREVFLRAGLYGSRVSFRHVADYANLPFVGRFANLIVSEESLRTGAPVGDAPEMFRVLRPSGGMICLGQATGAEPLFDLSAAQTWLESTGLTPRFVDLAASRWQVVTRPDLPGAGEWSHLYGRADNTAFGGESLGGASGTSDLQVQWIGRPGPRAQPDRNGRKPSPLSTNGRLFVQGLHRIIALDAFNGTVLWSLEIPGLERFNMPRDCSNWCADAAELFVAVRDKCWKIDAASGHIIAHYPVMPAERGEWPYEWGYIARVEGLLLGTSQKADSAFTSYWGDADAGWYDALSGPATDKVCSDAVFALDRATGERRWSYERGVIINSSLTIAEDRLYFVECRHAGVKGLPSRRLGNSELWEEQFLVALDLQTGAPVWEQPVDTADGRIAFYLAAADGVLVANASTNEQFEVTAFRSADGAQVWRQTFGWHEGKGDHGKAISRPALVGGRVYVRPKVLDLHSGEMLPLEMPAGKCGTYAATTQSLIFRTTEITLWNTFSGSASSWDRLRPDCWLSTIPAAGMLLSPEGGGGCSCGSWMEMSAGFMPRAD